MNIKKNVTGIPFQNTVTILYLLSGCLWILIADVTINAYFSDLQNLENYYIYKSLLYVVITATGLYWLLAFVHNKEIQNKEAFTNSILETADVGICVTDEQGNFVQVNQTFFDLFGHSKQHVEGTHLTTILEKEDRSKARENFAAFMKELTNNSRPKTLINKEGKQKQAIVKTHLLENEEGQKYHVISITDVTELQQKTKKLEETNKTLESLIEAAPVGIYKIDTIGRIIGLYNKAAEKILGWNKEEVINKKIPSLVDSEAEQFECLMNKLNSGENLEGIEIKRKRKDGRIVNLLLSAAPIPTGDTIDEIIIIISDITKQKKAQQEIVESLNEKKFLLQEIHHRVKNNLAIISGLLYLQANLIESKQAQNALAESQNRINSIANVHELLYQSNSFSEIKLDDYLDKLINELRNYSTASGDIDYNLDVSAFKLNINQAIPFGLIMNELLTNSIKHAFADSRNPKITIETIEKGDSLYVRYQDNGVGLENIDLDNPAGLGFQLISTSLKQLGSKYEIQGNGDGFTIEFNFPFAVDGTHTLLK